MSEGESKTVGPARPEIRASADGASRRWIVLVVDDEPQVHEITRLVLARTEFSGMPVELHSTYSAAEARSFLRDHPETALILLDVVMESDDAGLALVRHIRDELRNSDIQIVLRTGQPGIAPEREVTLQYEINGYFLKTEITAQKLYSIVISSLRNYQYIKALRPSDASVVAPTSDILRVQRQQSIEEDLTDALESGQIPLLAQPQLDLASNTIVGMELVSSWKTREGMLGPSQLAAAVHDPELRLRLDEWLLRQGFAWAKSWQSQTLPFFRICLPLVTDDLSDCRFLSIAERGLEEFSLVHGTLELEVPETILLAERRQTREALAFLQAKGIAVTLVDFGSGMISLLQLQRLLPDRVKIHRTFVRNVNDDPERSAVARTIIALTHTIGMTVVADGIATEPEYQFFRWEGCDVGQGDFLARSVAVTDVADVVRSKTIATH